MDMIVFVINEGGTSMEGATGKETIAKAEMCAKLIKKIPEDSSS